MVRSRALPSVCHVLVQPPARLLYPQSQLAPSYTWAQPLLQVLYCCVGVHHKLPSELHPASHTGAIATTPKPHAAAPPKPTAAPAVAAQVHTRAKAVAQTTVGSLMLGSCDWSLSVHPPCLATQLLLQPQASTLACSSAAEPTASATLACSAAAQVGLTWSRHSSALFSFPCTCPHAGLVQVPAMPTRMLSVSCCRH